MEKKFNLYRLFSGLAVFGLFVTVGLITLMITGTIPANKVTALLIGIVAIICGGCLLILPWAGCLSDKKYKILSIVFIALTGIVCLLWVICWILICKMFSADATEELIAPLQFLQANLIITIQLAVATTVFKTITKYGKTWIPFQVIYYLSTAYVDFYVTFLFCCIRLDTEKFITISSNLGILINRVVLTLFTLALVFMVLSRSIIRVIETRRIRRASYKLDQEEDDRPQKEEKKSKQEQLTELKQLFESELISEEEYNQKRKEILDK